MVSKELFFQTEERYQAPLTTGQSNELERIKMRNIHTGEYPQIRPPKAQAVATLNSTTEKPKRENKAKCLAIFERVGKDNDKEIFLVKLSKSPAQIAKAEQTLQNTLQTLQKSNPCKEYQVGEYRATDSEINDINNKINQL